MIFKKLKNIYAINAHYTRWIDLVEEENKETLGRDLGMVMRSWAYELLQQANMEIEIIGEPTAEKVIFVGNHVSYLDIPLLLSQVPVSFVAKEELLKWPILSRAFRRARIIFVKRESARSRKRTIEAIGESMKAGFFSVGLFPSGTTDIAEKKPWRRGAFSLAKATGVKIQPFRIGYQPLRAAAYIDNDFFPTHLVNLLRTPKIKATIEFHEPVEVTEPGADSKKWQKWSQELLQH